MAETHPTQGYLVRVTRLSGDPALEDEPIYLWHADQVDLTRSAERPTRIQLCFFPTGARDRIRGGPADPAARPEGSGLLHRLRRRHPDMDFEADPSGVMVVGSRGPSRGSLTVTWAQLERAEMAPIDVAVSQLKSWFALLPAEDQK